MCKPSVFFLAVLFLIILWLSTFAVDNVGVISGGPFGSRVVNRDDAARSQADWYDCRMLVGAVDTNAVINPITRWRAIGTDTLLVKAIYNSSGTITVIKCATITNSAPAATDTIRIKLAAYGCTPKLPALAKIFKLAATDTLIVFYQLDK